MCVYYRCAFAVLASLYTTDFEDNGVEAAQDWGAIRVNQEDLLSNDSLMEVHLHPANDFSKRVLCASANAFSHCRRRHGDLAEQRCVHA